MAHGHVEPPLDALLAREVGGPGGVCSAIMFCQVHEMQIGAGQGVAPLLGEVLEGAAWLLRGDDPGQVELGDPRWGGPDPTSLSSRSFSTDATPGARPGSASPMRPAMLLPIRCCWGAWGLAAAAGQVLWGQGHA